MSAVHVKLGPMTDRTLLAVDANSLIHRAFHAGAGFSLSDGTPAWAVRGFLSQLAAAVDRCCADALVVGFDDPDDSERRRAHPAYKAQRDAKLTALTGQLRLAVQVLTDLGVASVVPPGLEADDVLAAAARHGRAIGARVVLATSDRDAFSLIDDNTRVLRILNGGVEASPLLDRRRLHLLTGVWPEQYADFAALRGDPSDNLPGVRGIGPRKAALLLAELGSAEAILDDAASGSRCRRLVGAALATRLADPRTRAAVAEHTALTRPRDDLAIPVDPDTGAGLLPLAAEPVRRTFTRFELFVPRGLRALAGVPTALEPTWPDWTAPVRRHPPLPKRPEPHPTLF